MIRSFFTVIATWFLLVSRLLEPTNFIKVDKMRKNQNLFDECLKFEEAISSVKYKLTLLCDAKQPFSGNYLYFHSPPLVPPPPARTGLHHKTRLLDLFFSVFSLFLQLMFSSRASHFRWRRVLVAEAFSSLFFSTVYSCLSVASGVGSIVGADKKI